MTGLHVDVWGTGTPVVLVHGSLATGAIFIGIALFVRPTEVRTEQQLDRSAELLLAERFRFRVPLDPLPFGQEVAD